MGYPLVYIFLTDVENNRLVWFNGFWCLTPLSIIFQLYKYRGGQLYWWRIPEDQEKTTDLLQITYKLEKYKTEERGNIDLIL